MEEPELEEGEACYFKDDAVIDPDIALSYIDEKLQNVLGHFQKDFEGGVSAENLGAKFGGYGSFLPTYQRSPSVRSQPKTPQGVQNFSSPRSPNVLPVEGAPHNSTAPSDAARSLRIVTASCSLPSSHNARAPSGYVSAKQDSRVSSAQVVEKLPLKKEPVSNKPVNSTDQRTLKVRIKVGSDNTARKNAAIYSGLGLISPSSSLGNSTEESGGMPSECPVTLDESPNSIIRIMTSFPVPGGLLLSPLQESLLCLARKEKLLQTNKFVPAIKSGQEHCAALPNDSASSMGDKKVPKEKKSKILEKSDDLVVLKREVGLDFVDNGTTLKGEVGRNMENETLGWKQGFSDNTKLKPRSNPVCHVLDSVKAAATVPGVPREAERNESVRKREVHKDGMEDRLSTGLVKEEVLESLPDQVGGEYVKAQGGSSSMEKICENRLKSSPVDISTDLKEDDQSRSYKVSAPIKADFDDCMSKRDPHIGAIDKSRKKVAQTAMYHEEQETGMPRGVGKSSFEGKKKSKGSKSKGIPGSEAQVGLIDDVYDMPKDKKKASKMHNSKLQKEIGKARDNYKDVLPKMRVKQMNYKIDSLERPSVDRAKDSTLDAVEKKPYASLESPEEKSTCKKVDNLTSETLLKEAANDGRPSAGGVTSQGELTSVDPIVIEEQWVCCDRCQKWRLLPYGTQPEHLPEKWLCSMLNWLPGMNRCEISEEETTKALHALYQLPLPQGQNHVSGTAAAASSANACHFDQNSLNLGSHGVPNPQKKKQKLKATPHAASNGGLIQIPGSANNLGLEVVKRRSLNDMHQPLSESNLVGNSNVQHLSKSGNFPVDKNTRKQKEKHVNNGDSKQKKLKTKREADHYAYGITKKIKADVAFDSGNINKLGRGSGSGFPSKAAIKSLEKHDQHGNSNDAKAVWNGKVKISAKKLGESASVSLHTGSLDETSLKKRKLRDWQESQKYVETSQQNGIHLPESKVFAKEESSDSELRKGKKSTVSRIGGMESSSRKGDARLNTRNKVTRIVLSGNSENPVHGREEVRNIEKDQQPRKHKIKVASKPASDDIDPLKRDAGSEQFSRTATSSSSKVSGSHKSRTHFPEVKGSPVESVSSSPMRPFNLPPARKDILGKDAVRSGDFHVMDSPKSLGGEGNVESIRSGTARSGKSSGVFHSESLGFPALDFRDNNAGREFGGKSKSIGKYPPELWNRHLVHSDADKLENPCVGDLHASDHRRTEDTMNKNNYHDSDLLLGRSGKGSSLLSKDKDRSAGNNFERVKVKVSDPPCEMDRHSLKDEVEHGSNHVALLHEGLSDSECRIKPITDDRSVGKRGSKGEVAKRSNPAQVDLRGGHSLVFPPQADKQDLSGHVPHLVAKLQKGNAFDVVPVDSSGNGDLSKVERQRTNAVNHLDYTVPNRCALKDAPSPLRKDGSSHLASNVLKEAEDLRYTADRLKDSGFGFEYNEAYFQAALKFLHGASLLENCNGDSSKHVEMSPMQIYSSTAKLCENCAHEYEKCREMAAAALAYKCMEVACMRVVYCKNPSTNRYRHDLQASLQLVPQGESPSSSASDVDNLNNQAMGDKTALSKGIGAHAGNHVIVAHDPPNFVRLLDFTKDVNSAMEASRKSQTAFAAANVILEEAQNKEGIISVKRVIDFSFQDVEELIRLVRFAIGAISSQGLGGTKD